MAAYGRQYEVRIDGHDDEVLTVLCSPRGKKSVYACGDEVEVALSNTTQGVIDELHERRSLFHRSDAFKEKLIAANVTQVVIVAATEPGFSDELLMRCLCAVEAQNIEGLIVLNKSDLKTHLKRGQELLAPFIKAGHAVMELSATEGCLESLRSRLQGHVSLLVGQSGMGKTTLTNALVPDAEARTGGVSEALGSGKHTTTYVKWYDLAGGGALIDSPGLQAFGLSHLSLDQIENGFRDFRHLRGMCRFRDCQHEQEPHCAFRAAVMAGEVDARRFEIMRMILGEHRRKPKY